jgi:hypothetical protein
MPLKPTYYYGESIIIKHVFEIKSMTHKFGIKDREMIQFYFGNLELKFDFF